MFKKICVWTQPPLVPEISEVAGGSEQDIEQITYRTVSMKQIQQKEAELIEYRNKIRTNEIKRHVEISSMRRHMEAKVKALTDELAAVKVENSRLKRAKSKEVNKLLFHYLSIDIIVNAIKNVDGTNSKIEKSTEVKKVSFNKEVQEKIPLLPVLKLQPIII